MGGAGRTIDNSSKNEVRDSHRLDPYLRRKNGDAVGNSWVVPKGDFAHFMGNSPATAEKAGQAQVTGSNVIDLALREQMQQIGELAARKGTDYRNVAVALNPRNGRAQEETLKEAKEAVMHGLEGGGAPSLDSSIASMNDMVTRSHATNLNYLALQQKFMWQDVKTGMISDLMKVRDRSVREVIQGAH